MNFHRKLFGFWLILALLPWTYVSARAESDPHAAHRAPPASAAYIRTSHVYRIPDVKLLNQDGAKVSLPSLADDEKPIMLNFIFTSCTAICPVMSATFARARELLGAEADGLRMISITNDPHHDSVAILKNYSRRYAATKDWQFLTGREDQIIQVLRAFDAYPGNKMNHSPLTFLKAAHTNSWIRIEGLVTSAKLTEEYRKLTARKIAQ